MSGLAFVGIAAGTLLAIVLEPLWRRIINNSSKRDSDDDDDTGTGGSRPAPEATALVMSIGAVLTPLGQLVFSWTCLPRTIHPALPIALAGIPFGMGNTLSFIYGSNYLAASYGIYAASALAGNAVIRSAVGGALPLAGPAMYEAMTPRWAGTFLGLLEVLLVPVPFVFYRYGDRIRARSRVIRLMREEQARSERRRRTRRRQVGRVSKNGGDGGDGNSGGDAGIIVTEKEKATRRPGSRKGEEGLELRHQLSAQGSVIA